MSAAKRSGARFEQQVADYLVEHGFPYAERRHTNGAKDRGDLSGIPGWVCELKATRELDVAGAIDEAAKEAANAGAAWYVAILKRRRKPTADAYVVLPLYLFAELVREDR